MDGNAKTKAEKYAVGGLAMVFLLTSFNAFHQWQPSGARVAMRQAASVADDDMPSPLQEAMQAHLNQLDATLQHEKQVAGSAMALPPAGIGYAAQQLRDPLKSWLPAPLPEPTADGALVKPTPEPPPPPPPTLSIRGIVLSDKDPVVILDDGSHAVGDVVQGAKIVSISRGEMTVEYFGKSIVYTMRPSSTSERSSLSLPFIR